MSGGFSLLSLGSFPLPYFHTQTWDFFKGILMKYLRKNYWVMCEQTAKMREATQTLKCGWTMWTQYITCDVSLSLNLCNDLSNISHILHLYYIVIPWYFPYSLKMPGQHFLTAQCCYFPVLSVLLSQSVCVRFKIKKRKKKLLLSVGRGCVVQISTHIIVKWIFTLWTGALASVSRWHLTWFLCTSDAEFKSEFHIPDGMTYRIPSGIRLGTFPQFQKSTKAGLYVIWTSWFSDCLILCEAKCNSIAGTVHSDII